MMSRLKSGPSRERWWRGWERVPELCQVCIHTQHVFEWAFYITFNLDQMAYTQWAAVHGYWYIVICACVLLCVGVFERIVCVAIHMCGSVNVSSSALPYVWACSLCASVFFLSAFVYLCVLVFDPWVRACVCVWVFNCAALWPVDAVLCIDNVPSSLPVSHSVVSSFSQKQARSQAHSLLNYEMHISCLCSLYLIISHSVWFMP